MHRLLRAGVLIMFGMLIISIINGCADNSPEDVTDPPQSADDIGPASATEVVIDPPPRGNVVIPQCIEFTLTFNEGVVAVTVNETPATGSGLNWEWFGGSLSEGTSILKIMWTNRDGSTAFAEAGPYHVVSGCPGEPPYIASGTVSDGANDIDPAPINAGGFRFDFDEPITGTIKLTDEAGADLHWIGNVAGQTATLNAIAGQELANETTYKIEINVQDPVGNGLQATITFVTKPK